MIFAIAVMFHGKHGNTGYISTDFFCETCPAIASNKVKKGIKGYVHFELQLKLPT